MLVALKLPPGLYRNGTILQSSGRWYDANLVRFYQGTLMPMGGWIAYTATTITGACRQMLTWIDNSALKWVALGTHSHLYVMNRAGDVFDITPVGFTTGVVDATTAGGFGSGYFGVGYFGTPRPDSGTTQDATVGSLDNFGENLLFCTADDGKLYKWTLDTGTVAAAISGAPTNNRAVVVTEEGFIFCLGDDRIITWCDQQDDTNWTPGPTNQAGSYPIQTNGRLMCGKRYRGGTLIFTDLDVYLATYLGPPLVYGFQRIGSDCGVISQGAVVVADNLAVWMTKGGFFTYDGFLHPLESDVGDDVFSNINTSQASKTTAIHNPVFGEIEWHYPSANSTENDMFVRWNYREGHWITGTLARTCGMEQGVFNHPFMIGAPSAGVSIIYQHEYGTDYEGAALYIETGPLEIAQGGRVMHLMQMIPDEKTLGDLEITLYARMYPTDSTEETFGPYTATEPTSIRVAGREIRARFTATTTDDWRLGFPKFDAIAGGAR